MALNNQYERYLYKLCLNPPPLHRPPMLTREQWFFYVEIPSTNTKRLNASLVRRKLAKTEKVTRISCCKGEAMKDTTKNN